MHCEKNYVGSSFLYSFIEQFQKLADVCLSFRSRRRIRYEARKIGRVAIRVGAIPCARYGLRRTNNRSAHPQASRAERLAAFWQDRRWLRRQLYSIAGNDRPCARRWKDAANDG